MVLLQQHLSLVHWLACMAFKENRSIMALHDVKVVCGALLCTAMPAFT
jgi:hypothetical protein